MIITLPWEVALTPVGYGDPAPFSHLRTDVRKGGMKCKTSRGMAAGGLVLGAEALAA